MTIPNLKQAGFSEQEIAEYNQRQNQSLIAAGFSDEEINDYNVKQQPEFVGPTDIRPFFAGPGLETSEFTGTTPPRRRIESPGISVFGPQDVFTSQDPAITEGPGAQFTGAIAKGAIRQTQVPALLGRQLAPPETGPEKVGEFIGATTESIVELVTMGKLLKTAGFVGKGILGKAAQTGLTFGATTGTQELRKGIAEHIHDDDFGYEGGQAVAKSIAFGAALSIASSGVKAGWAAIWNRLKPTEQVQALKLLGLKKGATLEQINKSARSMAAKYHPDKVKGMRQKFEEVINARDVLRQEARPDIVFRGQKPVSRGRLIEGEISVPTEKPTQVPKEPKVTPEKAKAEIAAEGPSAIKPVPEVGEEPIVKTTPVKPPPEVSVEKEKPVTPAKAAEVEGGVETREEFEARMAKIQTTPQEIEQMKQLGYTDNQIKVMTPVDILEITTNKLKAEDNIGGPHNLIDNADLEEFAKDMGSQGYPNERLTKKLLVHLSQEQINSIREEIIDDLSKRFGTVQETTVEDGKEVILKVLREWGATTKSEWQRGKNFMLDDDAVVFTQAELTPTPQAKAEAKPVEKGEIDVKEEAITEPKPSIEEQQRKAGPTVSLEPTGKLDPTNPEEAKEIIAEQIQSQRGEFTPTTFVGIYKTKFDKETKEEVITEIIYSHQQVDQAYRTLQTEIESPQDDVSLWAMPGKEKELGAIGQKMAKMKALAQKKRHPSVRKATQLPKAKTKKEDFIKSIRVASATEDKAYALSGVFVEGGNLVATDGRRMFVAKGKWGKGGIYNNKASLKDGLLGKADKEGKYPKWQDIVPDYNKSEAVILNKEAMADAWRRLHQAAVVTSEESKGIVVILNKDGSLGFAASAPEVGHTEINVQPGGKILGAANPRFLMDALAFHAVRGDKLINFYFPHPDRPILTTSPDGKTKTVTMPVTPGEPSEALKKELGIAEEKPKPKGGAGGASVAAASSEVSGGGYGTVEAKEKNKFSDVTNKKRFRDEAPDKTGLKAVDEVLKTVAPASREGARAGARVLRKNIGRLAQETTVAHEALRKAHHAFTFMNRADAYEFIDKVETGQPQKTPKLNEIAKSFRKMLDGRREAVRALGKGHLESFYENYFPHIWKDPSAAKKAIMQIFGKRRLEGSKAFLKKRTIMTVKEGREAGLELVSENPVDLVLLKVYEMDRYIMAQRTIQDLKERGLIKFVYSRSKRPDGYVKVNDNAFTVYMPPEITKKEAFDQLLIDQMMDIARSLGIDTKRFTSLGRGKGRWWGYAKKFPESVRTRFAGPESVLYHEIGHVLGFRYNLYETLGRRKEGVYKTISRGKKKGEQRFVHAKDAVEHRRTIDKEWRALADERFKGQQPGPGYKGYVRKAAEKEAVLLEALIHAPGEFKRVAPTLYDLFTNFLNEHSELRPILDMKPSLVLGTADAKIEIPGFTTLGHYYAPEPVGKILNNYLSPGLRNSENRIIGGGYNIIRMAGNILNQAQLALSGFHGLNVTTDMIASTLGLGVRQLSVKGQRVEGVGNIMLSGLSPIARVWEGTRLRKAYKQQIDSIEDPRLQALVRATVLADGRDRMDPFYYNQAIKALKNTASDLMHGSPKQKIAGVFKLPFQTFGATLETLAKPLMEWYVPTGKLGLFSMLAEHEMKRAESGQITDEQLHERLISSWDSVDNRMGQLVYDNLFWNKTFKDVAMLAVRSVGWNLGSWREYGGVPVDILGTKGRLERGDVWLSQKMAYTIGAVTLYATLGAVIGYILTGKRPEEPKDYFFPKTGNKNPDGSDERLSLPTYAKDWFAYGTQPFQTVKNKLHPIWGLLMDVASNKDFFNTQLRDPKDPISKQLYDVFEYIGKEFLPLSARNYQKMSKSSPGRTGKNAWVSITGITSAPSYITRSPAQKLMYRYIIENIPDKTQTKEKSELKQYRRNIKNRLRKGDPVDRAEAMKRLGIQDWLSLKKEVTKEPFAEAFGRLSLDQALNVYAIASPDEKNRARITLNKKWGNAINKTPEMRQMMRELTQGAN